jgi:glycerol-3-phosphate dehydrogenase
MLELSAATRSRDLAAMADDGVDVLVIGGGITAAGVLLDAASRGLSAALIERDDLASGTSGRSSRLIHGGPRYLRQGRFGLVREALRERWILRRLAPHLIRPFRFVLPTRPPVGRLLAGVGLTLYDALAWGRNVGRHRSATAEEVARLVPGLAQPSPGHVFWDCRTDDARLTLEVVRIAVRFGARVATRVETVDLLGEGRVRGVRVRDRLTGSSIEIRARVTVNATGAWADRVHALAGAWPPASGRARASTSFSTAVASRSEPRCYCRRATWKAAWCSWSHGGPGCTPGPPTRRTTAPWRRPRSSPRTPGPSSTPSTPPSTWRSPRRT